MDRPIDTGVIRQQRIRHFTQGILLVIGLLSVLVWLPGWIAPSVLRDRVSTARVEWGRVEATVTASGTVMPAFERVMSSPISSRVLRILKQPGEQVKIGDPILELDLSATQLALDKLNEELALKANQQTRLRIILAQQLNDLESQQKVKDLDLQYLEAEHARILKMDAKGLVSRDRVHQSELAVEKARLEGERLLRSIGHAQESMQAQLDGLTLEMNILHKQRVEMKRQLSLAKMRADRDGVLTWVVSEEGTSVGAGEVIVHIADLSAFQVEGKISEVHVSRIYAGLLVKVRVKETYLQGTIANVMPTLQDGIVTFLVRLDAQSHPLLRANLHVDVYPILDRRENALRIKRGLFINGGEGLHDVFVIRGDQAVKQVVQIGLSGYDFFEVIEGLDEGEEVIISDMRDYLHMETVAVK